MSTGRPYRRQATAFALAFVIVVTGMLDVVAVSATHRYRYIFPVVGHSGYAHKHSGYPATDIIAKCGLSVVSAVDGVVLEADDSNLWAQGFRGGPYRGGIFVSILGVDGVRYYGSHLSKITDGIEAGVRVTAGQEIGRVGRTGRAGSCHLHFGISPKCAGTGDWWIRRGVVWPWPYLDTWRRRSMHKHRSPAPEVRAWLKANGCPSKPT